MRYLPAAAFVTIVIAANAATNTLGLVHWLGLTATAGTWIAGFALVARDSIHDTLGRRWIAAAILAGAAISATFSPALALASAVAFAASESADWAIYAPLRRRGRTAAALASNAVGAVVDSVLFLAIAGFPLSAAWTQTVVKIGTTSLLVIGVSLIALLRQPVRVVSGGRNA